MKLPRLRDDAFLADVAAAHARSSASGGPDTLSFWWLGQSGFLLLRAGRFVLLDPYLSDSLTRKYAATDKPHVRLTERVIAPERLPALDAVSASHVHTDHLDPETLRALVATNPHLHLICPEAIRTTARERSGLPDAQIHGLDVGSATPAEFTDPVSGASFRAIPAAHEALERDREGRLICLGFVVRWGPFTLFHSGDTVLYPGFAEALRNFSPDVAFLPINGRAPERRVSGNLWGREAAALAKDTGTRCVVPCHYDMFAFNTATPKEFERECQRLDQNYRVMEHGERHDLRA